MVGSWIGSDDGGIAFGRDEVEVHSMMLNGVGLGGSGIGCPGAQEPFAFEEEFLPFEIEGGQFFDTGEKVSHDRRARNGAGEVEGFSLKEMTNGILDTRGLGEFGIDFHVSDGIEHVLSGSGVCESLPKGAEAAEGDGAHGETQAFRWRSGDARMNLGDIVECKDPFVNLPGLFAVERAEKRIGALPARDGVHTTVGDGIEIVRGGSGELSRFAWV